jgi:L-threonylcarbamoyladenylate synthase
LAVLDGGACTVGIESTIIDCTRGQPVLLRPGMVSREQIAAVCGGVVRTQAEIATEPLHATGVAPRASGTLDAHYAPRAKVRLMEARALRTALRLLGADAHRIAVYARTPLPQLSPQVVVRAMPDDPGATAQQLFAVLRAFDDADVALIWVETPPATADWEGVSDRLRRAAAS